MGNPPMAVFTEKQISTENYWRAIILYGRNVATYKFALGLALLELAEKDSTFVKLEDLAVPFSKYMSTHLKKVDSQITSASSKYLDACRQFNKGEVNLDQLVTTTTKLGFVNVIDAFHIVNQQELPERFFIDDREAKKGIEITDHLLKMKESIQFSNLPFEVEARWRLVETAWSMSLSPELLDVTYDENSQVLYTSHDRSKRISITSSKDALNGYQRGKCFYCFDDIMIESGSDLLADVDHVFPITSLAPIEPLVNFNGIWNLVLSCKNCNRGIGGKFALIPDLKYIERLHRRNSYLIESHHPLRETLIKQTGKTEPERQNFLQKRFDTAKSFLIHTWSAKYENEPVF